MAEGHIRVPDELADFLTVESCSDFPKDRYLLTPNQKQIAEDILRIRHITSEMRKLNLDYLNATLLYGVPGTGKAQPLYSKILTSKGYKRMGDIHPGDKVMTPGGHSATVESIFPQGIKDIYEVELDDGSKCRCSDEHLWEVQGTEERQKSVLAGRRISKILTLAELQKNLAKEKYCIPDTDILEYDDAGEFPDHPMSVYVHSILGGEIKPDDRFLFMSSSFRQELYKGLTDKARKKEIIDTYGEHLISLKFALPGLSDFVTDLARSLGIKASARSNECLIYGKGKNRYIVGIKPVGREPCQCIYVSDPRHLYITDDYIPTHNTTFGRYMSYKLKIDFAFLNFANIVSGGIMGDTSRNISKVFNFMKEQKCIFMLDEIDCISVSRGQESSATGGELSRITITVMQELDKYKRQKVNSIIIAATNRIEDVDPALRSRFAIKKEIVAWTNDQKEIYAKRFLKAIDIPYDDENVHQYCARNSTLQQREIEADMIRCIANWIEGGRKSFLLNHIKER